MSYMIPQFLAMDLDIDKISALVTGSCGALVLSLIGLWWQSRQIERMGVVIEEKNKEILSVAKEAIACITNTTILNKSTQASLTAISQQLNRMEAHK